MPTSTATTPAAVPAYLKRFSEAEQQAYGDAVDAYRQFSDQQAIYMAAGKATPEAKRFYVRRTAAWKMFWATLQQREANNVRVKGKGKVLRIRPTRIHLHGDGSGSVNVNVCGVSTGVKVFHDGTPVPQPKPVPTTVRVEMVKLDGEQHWRVLYERVGPKC